MAKRKGKNEINKRFKKKKKATKSPLETEAGRRGLPVCPLKLLHSAVVK